MNEQTSIEDTEPSAEELFEPSLMLKELEESWTAPTGDARPDRMPLIELEILPALFQPRAMSEKHIEDLKRAIKVSGELDPITVLPVGSRLIIIDGHHRAAAYAGAEITAAVPVVYFEGNPRQALFEAGKSNSKAKLPMENGERQNFAWRLVLLREGSKSAVSQASGISPSQVAIMRRVRDKLEDSAYGYVSWIQALNAANGKLKEMNGDQLKEWKEATAAIWTDKLHKQFAKTMPRNPEVAALALADYFGRKLPDLVIELRGLLAEEKDWFDDGEDEELDF